MTMDSVKLKDVKLALAIVFAVAFLVSLVFCLFLFSFSSKNPSSTDAERTKGSKTD